MVDPGGRRVGKCARLLRRGNMDSDVWFYVSDGGSEGPETSQRLLELLNAGKITRQTLVWRQGAPDWQPMESALGLADRLPPPIPGRNQSATQPPPIPAAA